MSNNLIDNKPTEIVNNDDEDDKDDKDDGDGDEDDDERIDNEAKNVNDDNSDGATIRRQQIRKPKAGRSRRPSKQRNKPRGAGGLLAGRQLETRRIKK